MQYEYKWISVANSERQRPIYEPSWSKGEMNPNQCSVDSCKSRSFFRVFSCYVQYMLLCHFANSSSDINLQKIQANSFALEECLLGSDLLH